MYFRARARVRGLYYDSYASSPGPGTTRNTRARGALVRAARAGRRAAVESSSRARPCGAWKTLVRRYDLPLALRKALRTGRANVPWNVPVRSANRSMPASHSALTSSPMAHKRHHPSGQSLRRGSAAPYPCARAHSRRCGRTPACPECPALEWSRPAHRTCSTSSPAG